MDALKAKLPRLCSFRQRDAFRDMPKIVALRLGPDRCIGGQIEVRYEEDRQTKIVWIAGEAIDSQVSRVVATISVSAA